MCRASGFHFLLQAHWRTSLVNNTDRERYPADRYKPGKDIRCFVCRDVDAKRVYYLSMEFLMGRSLLNALNNVGVVDQYTQARLSPPINV